MTNFETDLQISIPVRYSSGGLAQIEATDNEIAGLVHAEFQREYVSICAEGREILNQEIDYERRLIGIMTDGKCKCEDWKCKILKKKSVT